MVKIVRTGRSPEELAQEFEPTAQAIRNWVQQADRDEGLRHDGLTTDEREELNRLRRENRQLKQEREILKKPRPGSRGKPERSRTGLRLHKGESGDPLRQCAMSHP
jgi:transposase-like protein